MLRLLIAVAIGAVLPPYAEGNVLIQAKTGLSLTRVEKKDPEMEHFLHMLPKGHQISQGLGYKYRVRSDDFQFRIQFSISDEVDSTTNDFEIGLRNLGDRAIEVQHGKNYLWLEPGEHMRHLTSVKEVFNIRNNKKENMVALLILNHLEL